MPELDKMRQIEHDLMLAKKESAAATDPDLAKVETWLSYHPPTQGQVELYEALRQGAKAYARIIVLCCPPSADRTAALREVRLSVMTANASIACGGK